ncbi:MAG: proline iminopeptidase-family hydrolase [Acidobacteria bacterium]|nr:proline iminopeptidase-family hydrolase [Acidobacteriota bacterium]
MLLGALLSVLLFGGACSPGGGPTQAPAAVEPAALEETDVLEEGVRMIPVETPKGTFEVWTRKVGESPKIKVLLLHGGPGGTHEYLEALAENLPAAGIEVYLYDQLGSHFSDQPDDPDLWETSRFVDEVEQVRQALGLGPDNFYLYGHSWGGILAMEYALEYGDNLKGLIISNAMASIPLYNRYAEEVLMPQIDPDVLAEIKAFEAAGDYHNPRYMELLMEHHYIYHVLRAPADQWPDGLNRTFEHLNPDVYVLMQGPSELGASGRLVDWDRTADLAEIKAPTLVIGARYDTMDPEHMEWMAGELANGEFLYCPNGSHSSLYDDQEVYMEGLIRFIREVDGQSGG